MGLRNVRFPLALAVVSIVGCDESTTLVLEHKPAVRIVLDASRCPQVQKCAQCQLDFDAFDENGRTAEFPTLIWTSQNPSIATVTNAGRVNGWATGIARIIAEVLETGAADTINVSVTPPARPTITCTPPSGQASEPRPR